MVLRSFALSGSYGDDVLLSRQTLAHALCSQSLAAGLTDQEATALAHCAPGAHVLEEYGTVPFQSVMYEWAGAVGVGVGIFRGSSWCCALAVRMEECG